MIKLQNLKAHNLSIDTVPGIGLLDCDAGGSDGGNGPDVVSGAK